MYSKVNFLFKEIRTLKCNRIIFFRTNKTMEPNTRISRKDRFSKFVRDKDVKCVLSGVHELQCEAAHIVPLNGENGQDRYKNPEVLNHVSNGMLLSKELHYLYDKHIWRPNPNSFKEDINGYRTYEIEIAHKYKDIELSINKYSEVMLRSESHNFIEIAYNIFKELWYPEEETFVKLELKPVSSRTRNKTKNNTAKNTNNNTSNNTVLKNNTSKNKSINKNNSQPVINANLNIDSTNNSNDDLKDDLNADIALLIRKLNTENRKTIKKQEKIDIANKHNLSLNSIEGSIRKYKKNRKLLNN